MNLSSIQSQKLFNLNQHQYATLDLPSPSEKRLLGVRVHNLLLLGSQLLNHAQFLDQLFNSHQNFKIFNLVLNQLYVKNGPVHDLPFNQDQLFANNLPFNLVLVLNLPSLNKIDSKYNSDSLL